MQNSRAEYVAGSGRKYIIRSPLAAHLLIEAIGPGAIELVEMADGSKSTQIRKAEDIFAQFDFQRKVLKAGMVSPAYGDVSSDDGRVVCWADMGDDGPAVANAIMTGELQRAADFRAPSAGQGG